VKWDRMTQTAQPACRRSRRHAGSPWSIRSIQVSSVTGYQISSAWLYMHSLAHASRGTALALSGVGGNDTMLFLFANLTLWGERIVWGDAADADNLIWGD